MALDYTEIERKAKAGLALQKETMDELVSPEGISGIETAPNKSYFEELAKRLLTLNITPDEATAFGVSNDIDGKKALRDKMMEAFQEQPDETVQEPPQIPASAFPQIQAQKQPALQGLEFLTQALGREAPPSAPIPEPRRLPLTSRGIVSGLETLGGAIGKPLQKAKGFMEKTTIGGGKTKANLLDILAGAGALYAAGKEPYMTQGFLKARAAEKEKVPYTLPDGRIIKVSPEQLFELEKTGLPAATARLREAEKQKAIGERQQYKYDREAPLKDREFSLAQADRLGGSLVEDPETGEWVYSSKANWNQQQKYREYELAKRKFLQEVNMDEKQYERWNKELDFDYAVLDETKRANNIKKDYNDARIAIDEAQLELTKLGIDNKKALDLITQGKDVDLSEYRNTEQKINILNILIKSNENMLEETGNGGYQFIIDELHGQLDELNKSIGTKGGAKSVIPSGKKPLSAEMRKHLKSTGLSAEQIIEKDKSWAEYDLTGL